MPLNRNVQILLILSLIFFSRAAGAEYCLYIKGDARKALPKRVDSIEIQLENGAFLSTAFFPRDWEISIDNSTGPESDFSASAMHGAAALQPELLDGIFTVDFVIPSNPVKAELILGFDAENDKRSSKRLEMQVRRGSCPLLNRKGKQNH